MAPAVLVIDDNEGDRKMAALALPDCEIREAATLAEGLDALREKPPAFVLVDLGLPGQEAVEAITAVVEPAHHRSVAVIAYTAKDKKEWSAPVFDAGADGYVQKRGQPVEEMRAELQLEMRRALRQRSYQARAGVRVHEEIGALRSLIDERLPPNLPALIGAAVSEAITERLTPPAPTAGQEPGALAAPITAPEVQVRQRARQAAWGLLATGLAGAAAWLARHLGLGGGP